MPMPKSPIPFEVRNREYQKRYREKNAEKRRETKERWRKANMDKYREYTARWTERNPEKAKEMHKKYADNNPEKIAAKRRRRRALLADTKSEFYTMGEIIERDKSICHLCNNIVDNNYPPRHKMSASIDHVIPISKGGTDTRDNIKLAHYGCNSRKGNR